MMARIWRLHNRVIVAALEDRMIRASITRDGETEHEKAERERLELLRKVWRARYRDLPRPVERPPVRSEEVAERERAWEPL
jgi:hypothetical protein